MDFSNGRGNVAAVCASTSREQLEAAAWLTTGVKEALAYERSFALTNKVSRCYLKERSPSQHLREIVAYVPNSLDLLGRSRSSPWDQP